MGGQDLFESGSFRIFADDVNVVESKIGIAHTCSL